MRGDSSEVNNNYVLALRLIKPHFHTYRIDRGLNWRTFQICESCFCFKSFRILQGNFFSTFSTFIELQSAILENLDLANISCQIFLIKSSAASQAAMTQSKITVMRRNLKVRHTFSFLQRNLLLKFRLELLDVDVVNLNIRLTSRRDLFDSVHFHFLRKVSSDTKTSRTFCLYFS